MYTFLLFTLIVNVLVSAGMKGLQVWEIIQWFCYFWFVQITPPKTFENSWFAKIVFMNKIFSTTGQ